MKEVLGHDFFVEHAAAHSQMKEIAGGMKRIEANTEALLEGQAQIIKMSAATQALVENSTSKVKTCWGDAHERSERQRRRPAFWATRTSEASGDEPLGLCAAEHVPALEKASFAIASIATSSNPTIAQLCKVIFEATEVSTPTCFVILPYELPPPTEKMSEEEQQTMLDKAESWVGTVTGLVEEGQGAIEDPLSYAKSFGSSFFKNKIAEVKEGLVEKHLYLYLVDEYTQEPVWDEGGVFPIKIETKSDLVDK